MPKPTELAEILDAIQRPGKFYAAGAAEIYLPSLIVDGVGPIAFPLLPFQAEQLVGIAEQAPYGRGPDTLFDSAVRKTWQIAAEKVHIQGKYWQENLGEIVDWVKAKLGVAARVDAELYKLLVYGSGDFFISHRDTEKSSGMFATLVAVLPSLYQGGELIIRHRGEEAKLELTAGPSEVAFAAFYADCLHEVLPVASGCRLALIYNLSRRDSIGDIKPPDYRSAHSQLAAWLRQWQETVCAEDAPRKLIYPLEHAYTEAELSFSALKGADANRAEVAVAAAKAVGWEVYLALMSVEENGYAEYTGEDWGYYGEDEEEFEVGEVTDWEQFLSNWQSPDGDQLPLENFPFEDTELCVADPFAELEPDELYFQEATGNAGASFERTYRRAALVFWPANRRVAVISQAGLATTLPYMESLAARWSDAESTTNSPCWQEAHALAEQMIQTWPLNLSNYYSYDQEPSYAVRMLHTLWCLQDTDGIEHFISAVSAAGHFGKNHNAKLVQAMELLPVDRALELLQAIIATNSARFPSACANLLARYTIAPGLADIADLKPAAQILLQHLPGDANSPGINYWEKPAPIDPAFVVDLMAAFERVEPALAEQAAALMLSRPASFAFDSLLLPAALQLARQVGAGTAALRQACLAHLARRIAEPLQAPTNWARPAAIACTCQYCSELQQFLANPASQQWGLKTNQQNRSHVEQSIRQAECDVDLRTDTRGRPHTLIAVKNQASYERRVRQREEDLKHQAALQQGAQG
jgi:hypothetical protein